jgi:hypothetical protein
MKRIGDNPKGKLVFQAVSGTMIENSFMINHGLKLPRNKFLHSMGLFTNGFIETNKGRKIEVQRRKIESYQIHLNSDIPYVGESKEPIRIFPDIESNSEIVIPDNFFLPFFNCHGCTFAQNEFWINSMVFSRNNLRQIIPLTENIRFILEDEYVKVNSVDDWSIAILLDSNQDITHSVKREKGIIYCKYDGYQLERYNNVDQIDIARYGNGEFEFYKNV